MGWFSSKSTEKVTDATNTTPPTAKDAPADKPKCKICCACPDTKRIRDDCIATHGEEHAYCKALIEAHKQCLRLEGFNV